MFDLNYNSVMYGLVEDVTKKSKNKCAVVVFFNLRNLDMRSVKVRKTEGKPRIKCQPMQW